MIDDMYAVMDRINQLRNRFGLKRHNNPAVKPELHNSESVYNKILSKTLKQTPEVTSTEVSAKKITRDDINTIAEQQARKNHVSPDLIKAVISTESSYNPLAVSSAGARGLMQLMPSVMKDYGVKNPFNPVENIQAGVSHLGKLLKDYDGDYKKALAAYNAGKGAVEKHDGIPDYKETKNYIKQVIDLYKNNEK